MGSKVLGLPVIQEKTINIQKLDNLVLLSRTCASYIPFFSLGKIYSPKEWSGAGGAAQGGGRVTIPGGILETFNALLRDMG